jgi:hypothetical protein
MNFCREYSDFKLYKATFVIFTKEGIIFDSLRDIQSSAEEELCLVDLIMYLDGGN